MQWERVDEWHWRANTGHRVSRAWNGREWIYQAWPPRPSADRTYMPVPLVTTRDRAVAFAACHSAVDALAGPSD